MRVLHVLPSLDQDYGGPLRLVLDLSARALEFGLESEVLGVGNLRVPDNPMPPEFVHSVPLGWPANYRYSPDLAPWLQSNLSRFDGVVLHGVWLHPGSVVSRICRSLHKRFACFPHGMIDPWSVYGQGWWKAVKKQVYWRLRERTVFERACTVFYTTEGERSRARQTFSVGDKSRVVIPYGIDLSSPVVTSPGNAAFVQPAGARVALFLGRVHPKKNVPFLIEAWARAHPAPDWRLVIAGPCENGYEAELRHLVRYRGLERQVFFLGSVAGRDKSYLLHRADWFLLPSHHENFGIAVLEAIASGCPVAVSAGVGVADYFHADAEVLKLDLDCWVKFLRERMPDDSHRAALIALDREHVIPRFEVHAVARAWAESLTNVFAA
jgi:glycosyltransferase involved in cell wall biosynthesis